MSCLTGFLCPTVLFNELGPQAARCVQVLRLLDRFGSHITQIISFNNLPSLQGSHSGRLLQG